MNEQAIDQEKAEAFEQKMVEALNGSAVAMMTSIGHRTGLFDAMSQLSSATSSDIAAKAGLQERYVREWLGAMVTGGIVEYDPGEQTYHLPPEHAACLTRAASPENMAATMQWISVLGNVENDIVDCFRNGGGVHYSAFDRFHEVMAEESAQTVVAALSDHILPLVPKLLGALETGIDVLDIGCGSGRALNWLAANFPQSRFTGYDFSDEGIAAGWAEAERSNLNNIRFQVQDVSRFEDQESFDLVTAFDAIHDQAKPATVLENISRALRPEGTFLMQDIAASSHVHQNVEHPIGPFLYTISTMHCMTVSLAQEGAGLGTCWGKELACEMLNQAGFAQVEVRELDHDIINYYYIALKG